MEHIEAIFLLLLCVSGFALGEQDKRLLLHNDQDLYQVISSLQANMATLNASTRAEIAKLKSELTSSHAETAVLKADATSSHLEMSTLRSEMTSTYAEMTTLKTGITSSNDEIVKLKTKVSRLESSILSAPLKSGSVYVRWGRTSCPGNGTEMVYNGRMAGSRYGDTGGGANSLCLPNDPTWGKYKDGVNAAGTIYGTEIEVNDNLANTLFGHSVGNEDVPCAVCRTSRPSNVMISGRATCYPGWTLEYQGYVVGGLAGWKTNIDYACLDVGLEFALHGGANDDDHVVYTVGAVCGGAGSLPCPPYINGRTLSCVVCSK